MKTTIKVPKSMLTAPIDFGAMLKSHNACGVKLSYTEYDFLQFENGKIVLFDAYSAAHKYNPFDAECGRIAFPFYCGCMTDKGERVAYAGLRFGEDSADNWTPLSIGRNNELFSGVTDSSGVPISSGVCCISDETGYSSYFSHLKDDVHPLAGLIVLDGQTHARIDLFGKNYAVFSSGWGDGRYKCYVGKTSDGRVTAIIADFGMIEYPASADELVEVEVGDDSVDIYIYDQSISESQNNVAHQTFILKRAKDPVERMRAYSKRGYAYHSMNDIDNALADYMAAVECGKSVSDKSEISRAWFVYDSAAEIFCNRSDYDSAIKLMTYVLDSGDNFNAGAYVRLIDMYMLTKCTDKAIETAKQMMEKRPDDPVAHMKYAECCVAAMDYHSAAEEYEFLSAHFQLYENLFDEASCYIELGDYEQADAALERHPAKEMYEQYWYCKAYIDLKKHRLYSALKYAKTSHEIDREYLPALYLLIDIESVLNDYRAVARYAEEYKKLRPDNEYGYSICADAWLILGNFPECARNYLHLYNAVNKSDKYAALAAIVCAKAGDKKHESAMLRILKKKHSEYYFGVAYCINVLKRNEGAFEMDKIICKTDDDEFLLMLGVFLLKTNNVMQATQLLETICDGNNLPYDVVAQQIRCAEYIGNRQHFMSFFNYYADNFLGADATAEDKIELAKRFISMPNKHGDWTKEIK